MATRRGIADEFFGTGEAEASATREQTLREARERWAQMEQTTPEQREVWTTIPYSQINYTSGFNVSDQVASTATANVPADIPATTTYASSAGMQEATTLATDALMEYLNKAMGTPKPRKPRQDPRKMMIK